VADSGEATRQNVLKKALKKVDRCQRAASLGSCPRVAISERDVTFVYALDSALRDGGAKEVAAEVVEHALSAARVLHMHDKALAPHLARRGREKRVCFGSCQAVPSGEIPPAVTSRCTWG